MRTPPAVARALSALVLAALAPAVAAGDPPVLPAVDIGPAALVDVADVDGDGFADLVTRTLDGIQVHLGDGLGGFGPAVPTAVAGNSFVDLADFDGDGRDDLLAGPVGFMQDLRLLMSVGDGTFASPIEIPGSAYDFDLRYALGDLDGDGTLDVVTSTLFASELRLHLGLPGGGFAPVSVVPIDGTLRSVTVGDVNADGLDDVILSRLGCAATPGCLPIVLRYSQGGGALSPALGVSSLAGIFSLVAHDMDGDGDADLLARGPDGLFVQRSVGAGPFTAPVLVSEEGSVSPGMLTDENRDGLVDVLVQLDHIDSIYVLVTQTSLDSYEMGEPFRAWFIGDTIMRAADVDRDGAMDRVYGGGGQVVVARGDGSGGLRDGWLGPDIGPVQLVDVDGDGRTDVLSGHDARLALGRSGGRLGSFASLGLSDPQNQEARWLHAADFDGDGLVDLATSRLDAQTAPDDLLPGPPLFVNLATAPAVFADDAVPLALPVDEVQIGIDVGDLDGDGTPDVIRHGQKVDFTAESLWTALNDGTGELSSYTYFVNVPVTYLPHGVHGLELADLDADGDLDVLLAVEASYGMRSALNPGTGQFGLPQDASAGVTLEILTPVALGDSDGDGVPDLHGRSYISGELLHSYRGLGDGTFVEGTTSPGLPSYTDITSLLAGDIDEDGDLDLVGLGSGVFPFLGDGQGGFAPGDVLQAFGTPFEHNRPGALGDVDDDGALDIVNSGPAALVQYGHGPWTHLGASLAGPTGHARLSGAGPLTPGSLVEWLVEFAPPSAPGLLVLGLSDLSAPFKGGTLVPFPHVLTPIVTDSAGGLLIKADWPAGGLASGFQLWSQAWFADGGVFTSTTAVLATVP